MGKRQQADAEVRWFGANLRRDRAIRDRLRQGTPAWRVEELRAVDLAGGANLVRRLVDGVQGL